MRVRLTCLNAGDFFELDGMTYKKLEDREHGNRVEDVNGDIVKMPLMAMITKVEKPKKKKKVKAKEVVDDQANVSETPEQVELTDYPEDKTEMKFDYPN